MTKPTSSKIDPLDLAFAPKAGAIDTEHELLDAQVVASFSEFMDAELEILEARFSDFCTPNSLKAAFDR